MRNPATRGHILCPPSVLLNLRKLLKQPIKWVKTNIDSIPSFLHRLGLVSVMDAVV